MERILFTNVSVIDGTADAAYAADVLVEGDRIAAIERVPRRLAANGAQTVDGSGATLMPGLIEAHAHLSFTNNKELEEFPRIPVEEHVIACIENAKLLLDQGFTSCFSAAAAKPRLDVVLKRAIDTGRIPGPRLKAATQEMTPSGNLGDLDTMDVALPPNVRFTVPCNSPDEFRRACRMAAREGVDVFKVNVSGDRGFEEWGAGSESTVITDEELAAVVQVANARGKVVAAHAVSAGAVKMCLRHGVNVIYHAAFCDDEAMDMLEAAKDRVFVGPTIGFPYTLTREADRYGVRFDAKTQARNEREFASLVAGATEMRKRGIRVLPGGDYGLFCNPQGTNARDLEHFVNLLGFTPMQAIQAATRLGGQLMGRPDDLGCVAPGYLADLLLVDGDPLADVRILQDAGRFLAIMKGGRFHKPPAVAKTKRRQVAAE
ncbi:MAG TPA: amidohydrolase family protein [Methylomirabilota bacterium]|nr:amidohydrolase family protein [Methylomirabilota bacterium]